MHRPELDLIKKIEHSNVDDKLAAIAERIFEDELKKLIRHSYHSEYHEYVKDNGYPIPSHIFDRVFYIKRKSIEKRFFQFLAGHKNIILLGCEGSGKTTLIHRVLGRYSGALRFFYIDTSDITLDSDSAFPELVYAKLLHALINNSTEHELEEYANWIELAKKNNIKLRFLLSDQNTRNFVENYLVWCSAAQQQQTYIVLDNIDSISIDSAQGLFHLLNRIYADIRTKFSKLLIGTSPQNFRFIISCRTATYHFVSSASHGLFLNSEYEVISAEDDLRDHMSVSRLVSSYIDSKISEGTILDSQRTVKISLRPNITETIAIADYVDIVGKWLARPPDTFSKVVKSFCGRSIRRMKLYGVRAFSSPIIGRLALLEERGLIDIRRHDAKYIQRRVYEAIFDFRISGRIQESLAFGFPLNPFQIIDNENEYKQNPLIGIVAFSLIRANIEQYKKQNVFFAKVIGVVEIVNTLHRIGYSEAAIHDLFSKFFFSGLLRPIRTSPIVMAGDADYRDIFEDYIFDDRAFKSYEDLIFCKEPSTSMQFFNSAVRYYYKCGYARMTSSLYYECLLCLIFLDDIISRENQLKRMNARTGVLLPSYCSQIKEPILRQCKNILFDAGDRKKQGTVYGDEEIMATLIATAEKLYNRVYRRAADVETLL